MILIVIYLSIQKPQLLKWIPLKVLKVVKFFLTLLFRNYNFMLVFIMDSKTMDDVEKSIY